MFGALIDGLLTALKEGSVELLVIGALLLIVLVLTLPIYFVMKKFRLGPKHWRFDNTLLEDIREAHEWRGPTPEEYGRNSFVKGLDEVQIGLQTFYQYFLWFVLVAATVFIIFFFAGLKNDSSRGFLLFYFGLGYLFVAGFAISGIWSTRRQQRDRKQIMTAAAKAVENSDRKLMAAMPGAAALEQARSYLQAGMMIDSVCGNINPEYKNWPDWQREKYQTMVYRAVYDDGKPSSPEARQPLLTPKQIVLFIVVFTVAFALFTSTFLFMR